MHVSLSRHVHVPRLEQLTSRREQHLWQCCLLRLVFSCALCAEQVVHETHGE